VTDRPAPPSRRSTWRWWLFYLAASVAGVFAGDAVFTWVST
jgi:hypothetical protein